MNSFRIALLLAVCTFGADLQSKKQPIVDVTSKNADHLFEQIVVKALNSEEKLQAYIKNVEASRQKRLDAVKQVGQDYRSLASQAEYCVPSAGCGLLPIPGLLGQGVSMAADIGVLTKMYFDLKDSYTKAAAIPTIDEDLSKTWVNDVTEIDGGSTPFEAFAIEWTIKKIEHYYMQRCLANIEKNGATAALRAGIAEGEDEEFLDCEDDGDLFEECYGTDEERDAAEAAKAEEQAAEDVVGSEAKEVAQKAVDKKLAARTAEGLYKCVPGAGEIAGAIASYALMDGSMYVINGEFETTYTGFINKYYDDWIARVKKAGQPLPATDQ